MAVDHRSTSELLAAAAKRLEGLSYSLGDASEADEQAEVVLVSVAHG